MRGAVPELEDEPHHPEGLLNFWVNGRRLLVEGSKGRPTYLSCLTCNDDPTGTYRECFVATNNLENQAEHTTTSRSRCPVVGEREREVPAATFATRCGDAYCKAEAGLAPTSRTRPPGGTGARQAVAKFLSSTERPGYSSAKWSVSGHFVTT